MILLTFGVAAGDALRSDPSASPSASPAPNASPATTPVPHVTASVVGDPREDGSDVEEDREFERDLQTLEQARRIGDSSTEEQAQSSGRITSVRSASPTDICHALSVAHLRPDHDGQILEVANQLQWDASGEEPAVVFHHIDDVPLLQVREEIEVFAGQAVNVNNPCELPEIKACVSQQEVGDCSFDFGSTYDVWELQASDCLRSSRLRATCGANPVVFSDGVCEERKVQSARDCRFTAGDEERFYNAADSTPLSVDLSSLLRVSGGFEQTAANVESELSHFLPRCEASETIEVACSTYSGRLAYVEFNHPDAAHRPCSRPLTQVEHQSLQSGEASIEDICSARSPLICMLEPWVWGDSDWRQYTSCVPHGAS